MRKLLNALFPGGPPRYHPKIVIRDEIVYRQDTNEPFTGILEVFEPGGQLEIRANYVEGLRHGLSESFLVADRGQLANRANYEDGKLTGFTDFYYDDGGLRYRGNYRDGEKDGLWQWFDEVGSLGNIVTYRNGTIIKNKILNEDGSLFKLLTRRNGELVEENLNP